MKKKETITISVNELSELLGKRFGRHILIDRIEFADIMKQHRPKKAEIGIGGVLNISFHKY